MYALGKPESCDYPAGSKNYDKAVYIEID